MKNDYSINKRKNGYYQIEYRNPETEKRERKSLGTTDINLAVKLAEKHWREVLDDFDRGILVNDKSLARIYKEYYDNEPCQYNKDTIKRHFIPYLESKKIKIQNIKQHTIDEYYIWRKKQMFRGKAPTSTTLNRENCAIGGFIDFCKKHLYLTSKRVIELEHFAGIKNRRKAFSLEQVREIVYRAKINYENTEKTDLRAERKCIYYFIRFYVRLGQRNGTLLKLQWSDLYLGEIKPYINIRAEINKQKQYKRIPISDEARDELLKLKEELKQFCRETYIKFSENMKVFNILHKYRYPKEDGSRGYIHAPQQLRKSWNTIIRQCSFYQEGEDYSQYRIRHYKITSLMAQKGLNAEQIAKYCCTSPEMVKEYYDDTEALDFYDEFIEAEELPETISEKGKQSEAIKEDKTENEDIVISKNSNVIPFSFT